MLSKDPFMDNDFNQTTPPSNEVPPPLAPRTAPFGGAPVDSYDARYAAVPPVAPQPPKRSSRGFWIFLIVLFGMFAVGLCALFGIVYVAINSIEPGSATTPMPSGKELVGLLRVEDTIMDTTKIMEALKYYQKESKIKAVLVRIDSPGGAVGASQELYAALRELSASGKPVVACMGNTAASGGYYTAAAAEHIVANSGTLTGSIGVIFSVPNLQSIGDKLGVRYEVIKSGKFKDIGSMSRQMTDDERKLLQNVIDDTYSQFVEAILNNRREVILSACEKLKTENSAVSAEFKFDEKATSATAENFLRQVADGRVFTGRQALKYGLVDELGTQEDALKYLKKKPKLSHAELYEYKPRKGLRELFESEAHSALGFANLLPGSAKLEYRLPY
jgi:protease IV